MSIQQRFINHINELIVLSWEPNKIYKEIRKWDENQEKKIKDTNICFLVKNRMWQEYTKLSTPKQSFNIIVIRIL
jgi:hypothetical protein